MTNYDMPHNAIFSGCLLGHNTFLKSVILIYSYLNMHKTKFLKKNRYNEGRLLYILT